MGFVAEKIAESSRRVDLTEVNPRYGTTLRAPTQWVIDHERDVFLLWVRREREPPHERYYALCWQGRTFELAVLDVRHERPDGKQTLERKIIRCRPSGADLPQVLELASEALSVMASAVEAVPQSRVDHVVVTPSL